MCSSNINLNNTIDILFLNKYRHVEDWAEVFGPLSKCLYNSL